MADRYEFDVDEPHPNVDIDALRRYLLDNLATAGDHQLLLAALQLMSEGYLQAVAASVADRAALTERVAALEAQLVALTGSPVTDPSAPPEL